MLPSLLLSLLLYLLFLRSCKIAKYHHWFYSIFLLALFFVQPVLLVLCVYHQTPPAFQEPDSHGLTLATSLGLPPLSDNRGWVSRDAPCDRHGVSLPCLCGEAGPSILYRGIVTWRTIERLPLVDYLGRRPSPETEGVSLLMVRR